MCSLRAGRMARAGLACLAAVALAASAGAQSRVSIVAGTVHDSAGTPIPEVQVAIADLAFGVRSDSLGRFRLPTTRSGRVDVRFRRLGFDSTTVRTHLVHDSVVTISVVMVAIAHDLPGVAVEAEAQRMRILSDFYARKKAGFGYFITRDQFEDRHPQNVSDIFRTVPGVRVTPVSGGGRNVVRFNRSQMSGRDCPPQVYVDGMFVKSMEVDELAPEDIEAIEIYQGASVVPPQFNDRTGTSICGVVVVWTRVPGT